MFLGHMMCGMSVFCFHFLRNWPGFEKHTVFFSFVIRFRLVILFHSCFFVSWLDFFPHIRFYNRSDYILCIKLSLFPVI